MAGDCAEAENVGKTNPAAKIARALRRVKLLGWFVIEYSSLRRGGIWARPHSIVMMVDGLIAIAAEFCVTFHLIWSQKYGRR